MDKQPNLILLRQDLRLQDNPALWHAAEADAPLIVLYILDDETPGKWKMGAAQRWWLHYSLKALSEQLETYRIPLILRRGSTEKILQEIVKKHHVQSIYYNRCYEPYWITLEKKVSAAVLRQFLQQCASHRTLGYCKPSRNTI